MGPSWDPAASAAKTAFTSWVNQPYLKGTGTGLAGVATQYKAASS